jgi:transposase-like protein DUF772
MIFIKYHDRLGNNLFQWAFGRVLSKWSGAPMTNLPLSLFPGTLNENRVKIPDDVQFVLPTYSYHVDLDAWIQKAKKGDVLVQGYPHNSTYYQPSKAWLARQLVPLRGDYARAKKDDVVLHVRLGGDVSSNAGGMFSYPGEVFAKLLSSLNYKRCLIVTDVPNSPIITDLVENHRGVLVSKGLEHDYRTLYYASRLVMSPSTFSWWAAWTGTANEIYQPYEFGFWRKDYEFALDLVGPQVKRFNVHGEIIQKTPLRASKNGSTSKAVNAPQFAEELQKVMDWKEVGCVLDSLGWERGSRGHPARRFAALVLFKIVLLARCYGLADKSCLELLADRISWRKFLGFSLDDVVPDEGCLRYFRFKLIENGLDTRLRNSCERQLQTKGLRLKVSAIGEPQFTAVGLGNPVRR